MILGVTNSVWVFDSTFFGVAEKYALMDVKMCSLTALEMSQQTD